MELSCKSEYALLALLELATHHSEGEPLQIRQIAAQQNIPDRYLEQLLAALRRGGFVRSQRGAKGGYILAREPWKITLFEVLACLEGLEAAAIESDASPKTLESSVIQEIHQEARQGRELGLAKVYASRPVRTACCQMPTGYYVLYLSQLSVVRCPLSVAKTIAIQGFSTNN